MTRMAKQGDKMAILKLAGILIVAVLLIYWVGGWILRLIFGK